MKKGAIFDMDGLLFDTERLYRQSETDAAYQFKQTPHPDFTKAISGTSGEKALEVIRTYYPAVDPQKFWNACIDGVAEVLKNSVPKKPGVDEILSFFKSYGVKMAVASSSNRTMIENNLKRAGIADYFQVVVSGVEIARSKPAPDIFLKAAELLKLSPTECYVFEDSLNGIRAGLAAGCASIMIPDLTQPTPDILESGAIVYSSLNEACQALRDTISK